VVSEENQNVLARLQDFVDLSTGSDPYKLVDFLNLKIQSESREADSDSD
jgi:hypothetical protein